MWLTHFWHSWSQFFIFAWDVTAGGILRTGVLICLVYHYELKCQSAWQFHQVFDVSDKIGISNDLILCYGIGMHSQLCKTIDILAVSIFAVVLACLDNCTSLNIISLHQECCPYMLLLNNWWNQVSPFGHGIDNEITNSNHIVLRSRHNPRTGHGTI